MRYQKQEGSYQMRRLSEKDLSEITKSLWSPEFAKKVKESAAWMDGNGYLHAKPKEKDNK